jgi:hypothetical protein
MRPEIQTRRLFHPPILNERVRHPREIYPKGWRTRRVILQYVNALNCSSWLNLCVGPQAQPVKDVSKFLLSTPKSRSVWNRRTLR